MTIHPKGTVAKDADRRQFGRRDTFKRALVHQTNKSAEPCIVVNLSDGGALIKINEAEHIDTTFQLMMLEDDILVSCEVVHRKAGQIGLRFTNAPQIASRLGTPSQQRAQKAVGFMARKL